jgi:glycosyltransferase involved in cell wall biosynthesis
MIGGDPRRQFQNEHFQQPPPLTPPWTAPGGERFARQSVVFVAPSCASLAVTAGALIHEISQQGHRVTCFAAPLDDAAAANALRRLRAEIGGLPAFRQGFSPLADQRSVVRLVKAFRQMRPDIVAGFSPKGAALAAIAGRIAGVPHRVAMIGELGRGFEETPERSSKLTRQTQKGLLRLAFGLSHTAVFLNEENHKHLQLHRLLPDRLRQFPINGAGIDLRHFPAAPLPALDRGVMFLYAGPLDRRLGIGEFCEAARRLQAKPGNYKCLVAGPEIPGPHGFPIAELKRYRDVIQYLGPQSDPRPYMARTHVFVLPARGDAIPQALVEAIAMGRPVITSTSRGCRVAVREGGNGMIVPPGDASALAGAMARLLLRPDLIPAMSRASREFAESQFDSRRINARLLAALDL